VVVVDVVRGGVAAAELVVVVDVVRGEVAAAELVVVVDVVRGEVAVAELEVVVDVVRGGVAAAELVVVVDVVRGEVAVAELEGQVDVAEFEKVGSVFAGWQGQIAQLSSGAFEGGMQIVSGEAVRAVAAQGNQRLQLRGRDASGLLAIYPMCARMVQCTWNRGRLEPGQLFVGGTDDEMEINSERRFRGQVVFLRPDLLESTARLQRGADAPIVPRDSVVRIPSPALFAEVERRLSHLFEAAAVTPAMLGTPEGRQLEQQCILALAAAVAPSPQQVLPSRSGRAQLLDRAEELFRRHLDGQLGMLDLCQTLGANDRTLRLAFLECYGIGPMTYFRSLRLNAVRARLRTDPETAIADVARHFGFHHMGNFAAQYRRLFGRLPSAIHRR
jgi:AraC family ethanolamine operon transcriptional activator